MVGQTAWRRSRVMEEEAESEACSLFSYTEGVSEDGRLHRATVSSDCWGRVISHSGSIDSPARQ